MYTAGACRHPNAQLCLAKWNGKLRQQIKVMTRNQAQAPRSQTHRPVFSHICFMYVIKKNCAVRARSGPESGPELDHDRWFISVCFLLINYLYNNRYLAHVVKDASSSLGVSKSEAAMRPLLSVLMWSAGFLPTHSALWQAHSSNHGSSGIYWTPQRQAAGPPGTLWDISGLQPIDKLPPVTDGERIYMSECLRWIRSLSSVHQLLLQTLLIGTAWLCNGGNFTYARMALLNQPYCT